MQSRRISVATGSLEGKTLDIASSAGVNCGFVLCVGIGSGCFSLSESGPVGGLRGLCLGQVGFKSV